MIPVDVKELSPEHRDMRLRKLARLKRSVEAHRYEVDSSLIANGIIREAASNTASRKLQP